MYFTTTPGLVLGLERVVWLSISGQLLGQRGPVHSLIVEEPVDAKGSKHHTHKAHELKAHRVAQRISATKTVLPPELVLSMELKWEYVRYTAKCSQLIHGTHRFLEIPLVLWEIVRVIGIPGLNRLVRQMRIVSKA